MHLIQAAPEAAQIGAGATPASPISEQAAAMRDAAAKTSVESQMAKTAQQALPAPWVVAGTQQVRKISM